MLLFVDMSTFMAFVQTTTFSDTLFLTFKSLLSIALFHCTAQYGLTACFLLLPLMGCNGSHTVIVLVIGMLLYGCVMGGDVIVPAEVSANFATTIYSCINMLANVPGIIAPLVIGIMLQGAEDGTDLKQRWDHVFFMAAGVLSFGTTTFMIFGSSKRQDFDYIEIRLPTSKGRNDSQD